MMFIFNLPHRGPRTFSLNPRIVKASVDVACIALIPNLSENQHNVRGSLNGKAAESLDKDTFLEVAPAGKKSKLI